ncbi:MAG: hypothetical protein ACO3JL_08905 [Myxococcota bacterium]
MPSTPSLLKNLGSAALLLSAAALGGCATVTSVEADQPNAGATNSERAAPVTEGTGNAASQASEGSCGEGSCGEGSCG